MNKNLFLVGAVAVAGFFTLTAFGGKTLEQQQAEVKAAVDAKVASLRMEKQADCDSRVMAAAQTKYDEVVATRTAAAMPGKTTGKGATKPTRPRVDPLPQPTKPTTTGNPSKDKWNNGTTAPNPSKEKWTPATQNGTPAPTQPNPSKSKWDKPNPNGGK